MMEDLIVEHFKHMSLLISVHEDLKMNWMGKKIMDDMQNMNVLREYLKENLW